MDLSGRLNYILICVIPFKDKTNLYFYLDISCDCKIKIYKFYKSSTL